MSMENITISNVEHAYQQLAEYILDFIANRGWEKAGLSAQITPGSVTFFDHWLLWKGERNEKAVGWGNNQVMKAATSSVRFLHKDVLATTGQHIWGLTFTLYPNGKFNIEYDYNKPEDYEETDEVITGDEINQTLSDLDGNPPS